MHSVPVGTYLLWVGCGALDGAKADCGTLDGARAGCGALGGAKAGCGALAAAEGALCNWDWGTGPA